MKDFLCVVCQMENGSKKMAYVFGFSRLFILILLQTFFQRKYFMDRDLGSWTDFMVSMTGPILQLHCKNTRKTISILKHLVIGMI